MRIIVEVSLAEWLIEVSNDVKVGEVSAAVVLILVEIEAVALLNESSKSVRINILAHLTKFGISFIFTIYSEELYSTI